MLTTVKFNLLIAWAAVGIGQLVGGDRCPQNLHRPSSPTAACIPRHHPAGGGSEPISAESLILFAEKKVLRIECGMSLSLLRVPVTAPSHSAAALDAGSAPAANSD